MKNEKKIQIGIGGVLATALLFFSCQTDSPTDSNGNQNDFWQRVTTPQGVSIATVEINSSGNILAGCNDGIFLSDFH